MSPPDGIEIVVVDNASRDPASRELLDALQWTASEEGHRRLRVLRRPDNPGFGAGCNLGVAATEAETVLLLNPDASLSPADLLRLDTKLQEDPRRGAVGCRIVAPDGRSEPTWGPPPSLLGEIRWRRFWRAWEAREAWAVERCEARQGSERDGVPWLTAACLALRRSAFEEVGGFDERFFLYYEDVDLCCALRRAGWELHYTPEVECAHRRGASTGLRRDLRAIRRASQGLLFDKWRPAHERLLLRLAQLLV